MIADLLKQQTKRDSLPKFQRASNGLQPKDKLAICFQFYPIPSMCSTSIKPKTVTGWSTKIDDLIVLLNNR